MSLYKLFGLDKLASLGRIIKQNGGILGSYQTLYRSGRGKRVKKVVHAFSLPLLLQNGRPEGGHPGRHGQVRQQLLPERQILLREEQMGEDKERSEAILKVF